MNDQPPDKADGALDIDAGLGVGSRVGSYRLVQLIGRGGMAAVFRAIDDRLGRQVAVKILAPALATDEVFRQRFMRESRAAAAVDDPHIIPVFEAGQSDGVLFIAMRYVEGGDLRTLIRRRGALTPARATAITSPVASALDAAHAAGLVHRDVKPANMLLDVRPDRPDHVYLTDFGLSKGALSSIGLTGTGLFLGTPDYISPEQITGGELDGRSDQYSLACTAFELLSGRPPFQRDHAVAVIYAHTTEPPPPLTSLRAELPAAVDAVLGRALAKSPDDRYPNCRRFADSLREALGLQPYHVEAPDAGRAHTLATDDESATPVPSGSVDVTTVRPGSTSGQTPGGSGPAKVPVDARRRRRRAVLIGMWAAILIAGGAGGAYLHLRSVNRSQVTGVSKSFVPVPGSLHGVAVTSATSAWAVGQYCVKSCFKTQAITRAIILHWNGREWSRVRSPDPGSSSWFRAISLGPGSSAWAVGGFCSTACGSRSAVDHPLIVRWNGASWSQVTSPAVGSSSWLRAVTVANNGQAWAVGVFQTSFPKMPSYAIGTLILHWDGHTWTPVKSPSPSSNTWLNAVGIDPRGGAWAVGRSCVSACFKPGEIDQPLIVHWNGKSWLQVDASLAGNSSLSSVSVGRTDNVWAVGSACVATCSAGSQIYRPLIARWDGAVWSQIPSPSPGRSSWLYAVSATPGGDALAVGDTCVSGCNTPAEIDQGLVLKWNGNVWSVEPIQPALGKHPVLYGLNATRTAFVVGRFCTSNCFTFSERDRTLILRWNGTAVVRA